MRDTCVWSRDLWLARAICRLRPLLAGQGLELPERVTVTAGTIEVSEDDQSARGECWPVEIAPADVPHIVIGEQVSDPVEILGTLVHELIHASDDCDSGHGGFFTGWARAVGLEGTRAERQRLREQIRRQNRLVELLKHGLCAEGLLGPEPVGVEGDQAKPEAAE